MASREISLTIYLQWHPGRSDMEGLFLKGLGGISLNRAKSKAEMCFESNSKTQGRHLSITPLYPLHAPQVMRATGRQPDFGVKGPRVKCEHLQKECQNTDPAGQDAGQIQTSRWSLEPLVSKTVASAIRVKICVIYKI